MECCKLKGPTTFWKKNLVNWAKRQNEWRSTILTSRPKWLDEWKSRRKKPTKIAHCRYNVKIIADKWFSFLLLDHQDDRFKYNRIIHTNTLTHRHTHEPLPIKWNVFNCYDVHLKRACPEKFKCTHSVLSAQSPRQISMRPVFWLKRSKRLHQMPTFTCSWLWLTVNKEMLSWLF